jgi:small subunit ribosomal protein S7
MSRKVTAKKKIKLSPDHKYNSTLLTKIINSVMKKGKKSVAERIVYQSMERIKDKTKKDPLKIVEKAVENTRPLLETKSRRVGGATYQVPIEVADNRSNSLAIRWLLRYARDRAGKSIVEKFAAEIMDAADNRGGSIKKKEDTHKMAKANRAFAHYRW